jgi:hypothetical protein
MEGKYPLRAQCLPGGVVPLGHGNDGIGESRLLPRVQPPWLRRGLSATGAAEQEHGDERKAQAPSGVHRVTSAVDSGPAPGLRPTKSAAARALPVQKVRGRSPSDRQEPGR